MFQNNKAMYIVYIGQPTYLNLNLKNSLWSPNIYNICMTSIITGFKKYRNAIYQKYVQ